MKYIIDENLCTGCMACVAACHFNAIEIKQNKDGFDIPVINSNKCKKCGLCKMVCPVLAQVNSSKLENNKVEMEKNSLEGGKEEKVNKSLKSSKVDKVGKSLKNGKVEVESEPLVVACKSKDGAIKMKSSSGGIFTLIAEFILSQNGIVFGAKFDENLNVVHGYAATKEELAEFRGSKYVQSKIGNSYKQVKQFLEDERKVLFTGTPCQVEGLLSYLGKEYSNLYTQDIICHGVPSPKIWQKYIEYKEKQKGLKVKHVNFRRKDKLGWQNYEVQYQYENSKEDTKYIENNENVKIQNDTEQTKSNRDKENILHNDDIYMKLFLQNLILRNSCYQCNFKKINRKSDITLADFWGIAKVKPKFADAKGVSACIIHSQKGKDIFESVKQKIEYEIADINDVIKYNPCINKSTAYNAKRKQFFEEIESKEIEKIIKEFLV